ncbi:hypothetical protein V8F20_008282 [Naviculisporaceae sp. PSN 640]
MPPRRRPRTTVRRDSPTPVEECNHQPQYLFAPVAGIFPFPGVDPDAPAINWDDLPGWEDDLPGGSDLPAQPPVAAAAAANRPDCARRILVWSVALLAAWSLCREVFVLCVALGNFFGSSN